MKLYATVTSERASKGQGGNKFVEVVLTYKDGNNTRVLDRITVSLSADEKAVEAYGNIGLLARKELRGEKQKGEVRCSDYMRNGTICGGSITANGCCRLHNYLRS